MPWPISTEGMISAILPSAGIRMKAFGCSGSGGASAASEGLTPISRPDAVSEAPIRKWRRERAGLILSRGDIASRLRRQLDRHADARIGAASTDIAGHDGVYIVIGGLRIGGKQRR